MADPLKTKCLRFYCDFFVQDDGPGRHRLLEQLLAVRTLPADYPIPKLAGQRGVFAKVHIPADTVLGIYAGVILREGSDHAKSRDLQAELSYLDDLNPTAFYTEPFLAKYAVDLPLCAEFMKHNKDCRLTVSALQRGNCLSLINAYRKKDDRPNILTAARLNTAPAIVRMDSHAPIILIYAAKDIAANEQLFLDYGANYFKPLPQPIIVDRCDIADASEIGWINRFVRDANDATGDFALQLATVDELEKVTTHLIRERVGQFTICEESRTLRISSANMAAAISKQERIPADTIDGQYIGENCLLTSRSKNVPSEERIKRLAKMSAERKTAPTSGNDASDVTPVGGVEKATQADVAGVASAVAEADAIVETLNADMAEMESRLSATAPAIIPSNDTALSAAGRRGRKSPSTEEEESEPEEQNGVGDSEMTPNNPVSTTPLSPVASITANNATNITVMPNSNPDRTFPNCEIPAFSKKRNASMALLTKPPITYAGVSRYLAAQSMQEEAYKGQKRKRAIADRSQSLPNKRAAKEDLSVSIVADARESSKLCTLVIEKLDRSILEMSVDDVKAVVEQYGEIVSVKRHKRQAYVKATEKVIADIFAKNLGGIYIKNTCHPIRFAKENQNS